jgi:SAM-dependent methyltransferase
MKKPTHKAPPPLSLKEKYDLYEAAVQTPDVHAEWFRGAFFTITGRRPYTFREDFSGTFAISTEFVRTDPLSCAICLDLDEDTLKYGVERARNIAKRERAKPAKRRTPGSATFLSRLLPVKKNVISVTTPKVDLCIACNFSFNIFTERSDLLKYFKAVRKSLKPGGVFMMEVGGGADFTEKKREQRRYRKRGKPWFTYIWDQQDYDPLTGLSRFGIHFKLADGRYYKNVFHYEWRVWALPELRDLLLEAGFSRTTCFWEQADENGDGSDVYNMVEHGDNDYSYISYLCGLV